jgi:hypothetical protein
MWLISLLAVVAALTVDSTLTNAVTIDTELQKADADFKVEQAIQASALFRLERLQSTEPPQTDEAQPLLPAAATTFYAAKIVESDDLATDDCFNQTTLENATYFDVRLPQTFQIRQLNNLSVAVPEPFDMDCNNIGVFHVLFCQPNGQKKKLMVHKLEINNTRVLGVNYGTCSGRLTNVKFPYGTLVPARLIVGITPPNPVVPCTGLPYKGVNPRIEAIVERHPDTNTSPLCSQLSPEEQGVHCCRRRVWISPERLRQQGLSDDQGIGMTIHQCNTNCIHMTDGPRPNPSDRLGIYLNQVRDWIHADTSLEGLPNPNQTYQRSCCVPVRYTYQKFYVIHQNGIRTYIVLKDLDAAECRCYKPL